MVKPQYIVYIGIIIIPGGRWVWEFGSREYNHVPPSSRVLLLLIQKNILN